MNDSKVLNDDELAEVNGGMTQQEYNDKLKEIGDQFAEAVKRDPNNRRKYQMLSNDRRRRLKESFTSQGNG